MPYRESTSRVTFMECLMNVLVIRRPFICIPSSLPPFYWLGTSYATSTVFFGYSVPALAQSAR